MNITTNDATRTSPEAEKLFNEVLDSANEDLYREFWDRFGAKVDMVFTVEDINDFLRRRREQAAIDNEEFEAEAAFLDD